MYKAWGTDRLRKLKGTGVTEGPNTEGRQAE